MDTFIVRLWVPAESDGVSAGAVHGMVQHVATGRRSPFTGPDELIALLGDGRAVTDADPDGSREGADLR
jgi:hypothetical protein